MRVGCGNREVNFIKEEKQTYVQPLSNHFLKWDLTLYWLLHLVRIASGGWDKRLLVWDIQTGTILVRLQIALVLCKAVAKTVFENQEKSTFQFVMAHSLGLSQQLRLQTPSWPSANLSDFALSIRVVLKWPAPVEFKVNVYLSQNHGWKH